MPNSLETDLLAQAKRLGTEGLADEIMDAVNTFLEALESATSKKDLRHRLRYKITLKTNEGTQQQQWSKLFNYQGPDAATQNLLTDSNIEKWTADPETFFDITSVNCVQCFFDPQDELFRRYLLVQHTDAHACILARVHALAINQLRKSAPRSMGAIAASLHQSRQFPAYSFESLQHLVKTAIDCGSRYECWHLDHGEGTIFALGTEIPESSFVITSLLAY